MMAVIIRRVTNQLQRVPASLSGGVQLLMNIREEQQLSGRQARLRRDVLIRRYLALGAHVGIKVTAKQTSNITFIAVAK